MEHLALQKNDSDFNLWCQQMIVNKKAYFYRYFALHITVMVISSYQIFERGNAKKICANNICSIYEKKVFTSLEIFSTIDGKAKKGADKIVISSFLLF